MEYRHPPLYIVLLSIIQKRRAKRELVEPSCTDWINKKSFLFNFMTGVVFLCVCAYVFMSVCFPCMHLLSNMLCM